MKIILGSDHGGFSLKESIKEYLNQKGITVIDNGVYNEDSVDYPDIARSTCTKLLDNQYDLGILFCGTGIGISIAANKVKSIRCALVHNEFTGQMAKEHNNANFLAMGGRVLSENEAIKTLEAFLSTDFKGTENERHQRRVDKLGYLDN